MPRVRVLILLVLGLAVFGQLTALAASQTAEASLLPVGKSAVEGTAKLTFSSPDTIAHVEFKGMKPGTDAEIVLNDGSCSSPGASFATVASVTTDARGRAKADGILLSNGEDSVALGTVADGHHSISVSTSSATVSCGVIGKPGKVAASPTQKSKKGGPLWLIIGAVVLVLLLAAAGVLLMVRSRQKA
jgi:hypothetical protein